MMKQCPYILSPDAHDVPNLPYGVTLAQLEIDAPVRGRILLPVVMAMGAGSMMLVTLIVTGMPVVAAVLLAWMSVGFLSARFMNLMARRPRQTRSKAVPPMAPLALPVQTPKAMDVLRAVAQQSGRIGRAPVPARTSGRLVGYAAA